MIIDHNLIILCHHLIGHGLRVLAVGQLVISDFSVGESGFGVFLIARQSFNLLQGGIGILQVLNQLAVFLHVPHEVWGDMKGYLIVIFIGIPAIFLYNYFASYLRAIGNSMIPLIFLAVSAILNIVLDLFFVIVLKLGVEGAAIATVISQYLSGIGISIYSLIKNIQVRAIMKLQYFHLKRVHKVISFSVLTCIQQSVMNLGILMVQGLVNSFGTVVMAAFAAAVKIDAFAYMPVQDFGNAFSTFIAQNYGAKEKMRIQSGLKSAVCLSMGFCIIISTIVCIFAKDYFYRCKRNRNYYGRCQVFKN